jgi:hypothetical protein
MGSYQVTLAANTFASFTIPGPCNRFQVTQLANAATTYITGDGTGPVIPTSGVVNTGAGGTGSGGVGAGQRVLAAVNGAQVTIMGPQPGGNGSGGTTYPQVTMLSAASPTLLVEW